MKGDTKMAKTINEVLSYIDSVKPNRFSKEQKIAWLSTLDHDIKRKIIDTHEGGESVTFNGYGDETPANTELLMPEPYSEAYAHWLSAQMDLYSGELTRYNNSIGLFNTVYSEFENEYIRTHKPKGYGKRFSMSGWSL